MPRLRQISKAEATDPVVQYIYRRKYGERDPVAEPGTATGAPGDWETVFALSPDIFEHVMQGFVVWQSGARKLPALLRELAVTRAGWACGSRFVYSQHCKVLRAAGASEDMIQGLAAWQVSTAFDPLQRAVLAYADALSLEHGRTADGVFAALKAGLSDEQIVELTYITSMYVMHAGMTKALRLEFDNAPDFVSEEPAPAGFTFQAAHTPMVLPTRAPSPQEDR